MEDRVKTCSNCKNAYVTPEKPKYARCRKSEAEPLSEGALCGVMRSTGPCGPDAVLWEAK